MDDGWHQEQQEQCHRQRRASQILPAQGRHQESCGGGSVSAACQPCGTVSISQLPGDLLEEKFAWQEEEDC